MVIGTYPGAGPAQHMIAPSALPLQGNQNVSNEVSSHKENSTSSSSNCSDSAPREEDITMDDAANADKLGGPVDAAALGLNTLQTVAAPDSGFGAQVGLENQVAADGEDSSDSSSDSGSTSQHESETATRVAPVVNHVSEY